MNSVAAISSSEVGLAGELFDNCLELYSALFKTLHHSQTLSKLQDRSLRKQLERFLLWGDGFNPAKGELDSILTTPDGSSLNSLILQLLRAIGKQLVRRLSLYLPDALQYPNLQKVQSIVVGLLEKVGDVVPREDGLYDSAGEADDSETEDTDNALDNIIDSITTYVDCLMDTTASLEQAAEATKSRIIDFEISQIPLPISDASEMAQSYCRNILDKFPDAPQMLVQRLGEANCERHKRIRNRLENAWSLEEIATQIKVEVEDDCQQTVSGEETLFHDSGIGTSIAASSVMHAGPQNSALSTKPPKALSVATFTSFLTDETYHGGRMPSLPSDACAGKPFRCDLCGQIVRNVSTWVDWKRHVFNDLQPYICTFEDCGFGLSTFATRRAWWAHELDFHWNLLMTRWACMLCGANFNEQVIFEDHLEVYHKVAMNPVEIKAMSAAAERKGSSDFINQPCPICCCKAGETAMNFGKHVGKHIEEIALAVLPQSSDPDTDADDKLEDYDTSSDTSFKAGHAASNLHLSTDIELEANEEGIYDGLNKGSFKGISMNMNPLNSTLNPTLEGFRLHPRILYPRLPQYLAFRLGLEQWHRYKRLLNLRVEHNKAIQNGSCRSGELCGLEVTRGSTHRDESYPSDKHKPSDDVTGLVNAAQYPQDIPTPPTKYLPAKFECPICFEVKQFHEPSDWTKHVIEDVQPFTCTFIDCPDSKSFRRKADWIRHESQRHRIFERWQCTLGDCQHKSFGKDNLTQHLIREHKISEPQPANRIANRAVQRAQNQAELRVQGAHKQVPKKLHDISGVQELLAPPTTTYQIKRGAATPSHVLEMLETWHCETISKAANEPCRFCGNLCTSWKKLMVHMAKHFEEMSLPIIKLVQQIDLTDEAVISSID